jgi:hypothetical protein
MSAYDPKRTFGASFDHLVGAGKDRLRNRKPQRLGGLEIKHQFEFIPRFDRQFLSARVTTSGVGPSLRPNHRRTSEG